MWLGVVVDRVKKEVDQGGGESEKEGKTPPRAAEIDREDYRVQRERRETVMIWGKRLEG